MFIKDMYKNKPVISLEIFPPKPESPIDTIYKTLDGLKDLKPDFISVTYGAGGSNKSYTLQIAELIKNKYGIESLAHLTCIGSSEQDIEKLLCQFSESGIENILALRGDLPQNASSEALKADYKYAKDLVSHIKSFGSFSIAGACYPEGHMECQNIVKDLRHLKYKVEAGLDFLITQLFFDNNIFYDFREKLELLGVDIPVSVGIMPVINKKQVERIVELCGASLPPKFRRILDKYENSPEALKEAGIAYATEQIIDLLSYDVDGIHLYTMNRPEIASKIINDIWSIRESARALA